MLAVMLPVVYAIARESGSACRTSNTIPKTVMIVFIKIFENASRSIFCNERLMESANSRTASEKARSDNAAIIRSPNFIFPK